MSEILPTNYKTEVKIKVDLVTQPFIEAALEERYGKHMAYTSISMKDELVISVYNAFATVVEIMSIVNKVVSGGK